MQKENKECFVVHVMLVYRETKAKLYRTLVKPVPVSYTHLDVYKRQPIMLQRHTARVRIIHTMFVIIMS